VNSNKKRDPSGLNGKTDSEESSKDPNAPRCNAVRAFSHLLYCPYPEFDTHIKVATLYDLTPHLAF
jgi:hypothetical protein